MRAVPAIRAFAQDGGIETPLDQLIRHWMNERHAPDILPAQEDLMNGILDSIRRQSEIVHLLRGNTTMSEDEHIRITLVQTEIERVKFVVRACVCTRIYKIEKYARFIMTNADVQTRLTAAEQALAQRHAALTDRHYYTSVLQSLPEKQAHLDDTPIFVPPMVTEPDKTRPVFVHALQDCPPVHLPNGIPLEMEKDYISLTQYSIVEHLVVRGEAELV
ncbi:GINS complex, Sld5 component [Pluteus cervinus]|uniref:GINS complex, Sld5 component n=1 Tax=Pluteus cervinus TaxID=181527 RepID=A0ACD3AJI7_9AGAR|nr:GINS complex, Sld5 component [Pluteus cervinus]